MKILLAQRPQLDTDSPLLWQIYNDNQVIIVTVKMFCQSFELCENLNYTSIVSMTCNTNTEYKANVGLYTKVGHRISLKKRNTVEVI